METIEILGFKFVETCSACPEQYDVFNQDGKHVGYVRLRFGWLRFDVPDCGGKTIFEYRFSDNNKGAFDDENERMEFLTMFAVELKNMEGWL